jgi:hypothetical protein
MVVSDHNLHYGGAAENSPTDTVNDAIMAAVKNVFTDPRFHHVAGTVYGFRGNIDGKKVGVVAATKSQRFADSVHHVLNKSDFDSVIAGYEANPKRIDYAFVVSAEGQSVVDVIQAPELAVTLKNVTPLPGRLGEFYLVNPHFTDGEGF